MEEAMAAIFVLCIVLLSVAVPVHGDPGGDVPAADQKSYRSHHMVFDYVVISAALGTIGGIVTAQCHGDDFHSEYVVGHTILGGLLGIFAGASWGGEDGGPSYHPPSVESVLGTLRLRT